MEWQIFAMLQMALITMGVSFAFALHNRKLNRQNQQLRVQLEAQPEPVEAVIAPSGKELIDVALAQIATDDPCRALIEAVLHNALEPEDDFSTTLRTLVENSPLNAPPATDSADMEALQTRIAELEVQLAAGAESSAQPIPDNTAEAEELKTLLQQFTHDSREMMACIQELERENAQLQASLQAAGIDTDVAQTTQQQAPAVDPIADLEAEAEASDEPQVIGGPPPEPQPEPQPEDVTEPAAEVASDPAPVDQQRDVDQQSEETGENAGQGEAENAATANSKQTATDDAA